MRTKAVRKWTSIAVAVIMLLAMIAPPKSQAATYYFNLDDSALAGSRSIAANINDATNGINANAGSIKNVTNSLLTITGSYQGVTASSISLTVQQLYKDLSSNWQKDTGHIANYSVVTGSTTPTFSANNVKLFSGYNLLTFTGAQGAAQQSESFLVYYNDAPILNSLQVGSSVATPIALNEGASIVVSSPTVYFTGSAQNGSTISVASNQGSAQVSSIQADGSFYTPSLQLTSGKNVLTIIIQNNTNSLKVSRTIYYYDPTKPFLSVKMDVGGQTGLDLLNGTPNVTDNSTTSGKLHVQMLVPYTNAGFFNATNGAAVQVNGSAVTITGTSGTSTDDINVLGSSGTTYSYELVDFTTNTIAGFIPNASQQQTVTMHVYYNQSFDGQYTYNYLPGQIALSNLQLISGQTPAAGSDLLSVNSSTGGQNFTLQPLNNSNITSSSFYLDVTTDQAINPNDTATYSLITSLLPLSSTTLTATPIGGVNRTSTTAVITAGYASTETVWLISGVPSGSQQIQFQLQKNSTLMNKVTATVNFVSTTGISLNDLYDGQIITINTAVNPNPTLTFYGSFVGFPAAPNNVKQADVTFYVNNAKSNALTVDVTTNLNTFKVSGLGISTSGPLTVGQNTLLIVANYLNNGVQRTIQKSLKIYIVDSYTPSIQAVQPNLPSNRSSADYSNGAALPTDTQAFMAISPSIETSSGKFISHVKSYDLTLKGTGADTVSISMNGTSILNNYAISGSAASSVSAASMVSGVTFSFVGSKSQFYLRLQDLTFSSTQPKQVFTITITTATGSSSSQNVEVDYQQNSYTILAPVANQGSKIMVNKNFVTVDIQADGATDVKVNGQTAVQTQETPTTIPHFVTKVTGLKAGKDNTIKYTITWSGGGAATNGTITVTYSGVSNPGAQDIEPMGTKFSVFNKELQLTFPSGTTLKTSSPSNGVDRFYNHNLLFGIADPKDGVVQRQDDYGNIITANAYLYGPFGASSILQNFSTISPIYWISGGVGNGTATQSDLDGLDPYNSNGTFITYDTNRKLVPTNRGTLTLSFNDSVVLDAQTNLTVFYFNDNLQWTNLGGTVDISKHTITVPFDDFGYYKVGKIKSAPQDINNHGWARNVLQTLYAKGYMQSLFSTVFGTDVQATRGELATMLVKAMNLPLNYDNNGTFLDVIPNSGNAKWDYAHIETAARAGIVTGYDNQVFNPEWPLTREDAAVMIARAAQYKLALNDGKLLASLSKSFTDTADMNYYALPSIQAVFNAGIMVGVDNAVTAGQKPTQSFKPKVNLSRAELGQIAVRLMQKVNKTLPSNLN